MSRKQEQPGQNVPSGSSRGIVIDWFYFRPGCKSCDRTRAALEDVGARVEEERNSRKAPLATQEARELLAALERVILVRGRKAEERLATAIQPTDLLGPTGNFRAPMLRRGKTLLVGFHPGALERFLHG